MGEGEQEAIVSEPIGIRLKAAREAQGLTLDDVAAKTRIPIRHLQHIEREEWDELPAPTYSIGFARAYANAVGLNGSEIGGELRGQLGSTPMATAPQYEPADPGRVPPRSLAIVAAVIAVLLAGAYLIWRSGAVDDTAVDESEFAAVETSPPVLDQPVTTNDQPAPSASAATGPVVLTATDEVWLRVYDGNGGARLFENILQTGQRFVVPATAQRPMILTGRPDALRVTVGTREIPPLGPPQRTISDVSLLPADLLARTTSAVTSVPAPAAPAATP